MGHGLSSGNDCIMPPPPCCAYLLRCRRGSPAHRSGHTLKSSPAGCDCCWVLVAIIRLGHFDAVAAFLFGAIQRLVGQTHDVQRRQLAVGCLGADTDTHCHLQRVTATMLEFQR